MNFTVIIPARYASMRFPAKMLAPLAGKSMIIHVLDRARASLAKAVIVATDDDRIANAVRAVDGTVAMTATTHLSGTNRLAEVVKTLQMHDQDVVVNVQGDEPLIAAANINQVAQLLLDHPEYPMASLYEIFQQPQEIFNPNMVKVIVNQHHEAIYFSRAPIPWDKEQFSQPIPTTTQTQMYYKHIGLYAYRVGFLKQFAGWPTSDLAKTESLEQLTVLWHGHKIKMAQAKVFGSIGVDTEADLAMAELRYCAEKA